MRISVVIILAAGLVPGLAAECVADDAAGRDIWELRGTVASGVPLHPMRPVPNPAPWPADLTDLEIDATGSIGGFEALPDALSEMSGKPIRARLPQKVPGTNLPDFLDGMPLVTDLIAIQRKFNIKASRHHIESRVNVPVAIASPKANRIFGRPWEKQREEASLTRPPLTLGDRADWPLN